MLGVIRERLENRLENLIMLCINPCCVQILNIAYNFGCNSCYLVERKEDAENRNEDDQKLNSVFTWKKLNSPGQKRYICDSKP